MFPGPPEFFHGSSPLTTLSSISLFFLSPKDPALFSVLPLDLISAALFCRCGKSHPARIGLFTNFSRFLSLGQSCASRLQPVLQYVSFLPVTPPLPPVPALSGSQVFFLDVRRVFPPGDTTLLDVGFPFTSFFSLSLTTALSTYHFFMPGPLPPSLPTHVMTVFFLSGPPPFF